MLELLFLLLPIAVGYGWYMGKRSARFEKHQDEDRISREFVTGINFLLSDQKEQALELFSALAKEKGDDFEAHLTLGNLLRTRGQIDKALQIHESIIANEFLTFEQRLLTKQHLGKTYLHAGLLDRAENLFISLLEEQEYQDFALKQLLTIYQSTREWEQAIFYAQKLLKSHPNGYRTMIAHFYCELALKAEHENQILLALDHLKLAIKFDNKCARATLMIGNILKKQNFIKESIAIYQSILNQDPFIVIEVLPILNICYQQLGTTSELHTDSVSPTNEIGTQNLGEALLAKLNFSEKDLVGLSNLDFLKLCIDKDIGSDAHVYYTAFLISQGQHNTAYEHLKSAIFKRPTLRLFKSFISLQLDTTQNFEEQSTLRLLVDMLNEQIIKKPKYRCITCGFSAHSIYWHCPSCRTWATVTLIRDIEGQ